MRGGCDGSGDCAGVDEGMPRVVRTLRAIACVSWNTYLPENRRMGLPSLTNLSLSITKDRDGCVSADWAAARPASSNTMRNTMLLGHQVLGCGVMMITALAPGSVAAMGGCKGGTHKLVRDTYSACL